MKNIIVALAILSLAAYCDARGQPGASIMFIPQECGICNVGLAYFDGNSTLDNPGIKHRDWIGVRCEEVHSQDAEPFAGSKGVIAVAYVDIDDYSQLTTDPNSLFIGTYQNLLHSDKTTLIPDFSISSLFMF